MAMLPVLGMAHGIRVERYVHTETQDGKSPLDAHFGQASRKVRRFVQQGNNCVTPLHLVASLTADGGLANSVAELVEYERGHLRQLLTVLKPLDTPFHKLTSRANEVLYQYQPDAFTRQDVHSMETCPDFKAQVFAYSGVGEPVVIDVSPSQWMCKLHSGQCSDTDEGDGGDEQPEDLDDAGDFGDDEAVDQEEETDFDDGESMVDFDLEDDDDDGGGEETVTSVVHPVQSVGCITHVNITRTAQIQRRTRKWRTYTHPPNGNDEAEPPHNTRSERNLAAHAKKQLIGLRSTNSIQIIEVSELPKRIQRELGVDGVVGEPGVDGVVGEHGVRGVVGQPVRDFIIMGWGRRPEIGKMYGAKYVRLYAKDIEEMFNQGAARSSEKLGAGRIVEILKTRYPLRHNIPAEKDIKAEISRLFNQQKRRKAGGSLANPPPPTKPRVCIRDEITEFLVRKIQENPNMPPADAVRELHLHVPTATEDPSDEYLSRKFSSMKQQSRKKQLLSTLPTLLV